MDWLYVGLNGLAIVLLSLFLFFAYLVLREEARAQIQRNDPSYSYIEKIDQLIKKKE